MKKKPCSVCGEEFWAVNPIQSRCPTHTVKRLKQKKSLNHVGKVAKNWRKDRMEWIRDTDRGDHIWHCVIGGAALTNDKDLNSFGTVLWLTVDHEVSRTRDPSKRRDSGNFQPMCQYHNTNKGSRTTEEYLNTNPDLRCRG